MDSPSQDSDFAFLVEELTELVSRGDRLACEALISQHAKFADELRELLSTLATLVTWKTGATENQVTESEPVLDRRLGDYRIIREIGRGGMGIVYEAEQMSLDRRVALKVLPMAAFLDDRQLRRFKNEARAAASLQHPNIVSVHGVGCERSIHFYAMELIDGPNLASVIETVHNPAEQHSPKDIDTDPAAALSTKRSRDPAEFYRSIARLGVKTAEALHAAHEEGVVHRDIKPANLLLDRTGELNIADFGLARFASSEDLTFTGDQIGTLRYMSPEQVEADPNIDHRTDIYSLGGTLYEFLVGKPAFPDQARPKLAEAILKKEPTPLTHIDPRIPRDLETIIHKAISKEPSARYSTAQHFAEDLKRYFQGRSIAARPATLSSKAMRFARRNPSVTVLLAVSTVLFALLATSALFTAWRFSQLNSAEQDRTAEQAKELRLRKLEAYSRDMLLAQNRIGQGDLVGAQELLLSWVPKRDEEELRGLEWAHLWREGHPAAIARTIREGLYTSDIAFSPDGKLIAGAHTATDDPVWEWKQHPLRLVKQLRPGGISSVFAKTITDKNWLVMGNVLGQVDLWDWSTFERIGQPLLCDTVSDGYVQVSSVDVDPSGRYLATGTGRDSDGRLSVFSIGEGTPEEVFHVDLDGDVSASFLDETKLLYSEGDRARLVVFNVETRTQLREFPLGANVVPRTLKTNAKRDRIVIALDRTVGHLTESWIEVRGIPELDLQYKIGLGSDSIRSTNISPNGRYLAAGALESGRIWLMDTSSDRAVVQQFHHKRVLSVNFSPDNAFLATTGADNLTHLINVEDCLDKEEEFGVRAHAVRGSVFIRNDVVCTASSNQQIEFWNIATGRKSREDWMLSEPYGASLELSFCPATNMLCVAGYTWPDALTPQKMFLSFWDATQEIPIHRKIEIPPGIPSMPQFSPKGKYVAVARGNRLLLVDMTDYSIRQTSLFDHSKSDDGRAAENLIFAVAFSEDGKTLACVADKVYFLSLDDFASGPRQRKFQSIQRNYDPLGGEQKNTGWNFPDMKFLPASNEIAVIDRNRIRIFDYQNGEFVRQSVRLPDTLSHIAVSPDGSRLGVASVGGSFRILATDGLHVVAHFKIGPGFPTSSFSPLGHVMILPHDGTQKIIGDPTAMLLRMNVPQLKHASKIVGAWDAVE